MNDRLKRFVAFIIDWNISLFPSLLICMLIALFVRNSSSVNPLIILLFFICIITGLAVFVLRDVIFKGRSIGKRIFRLYVLDKHNLSETSVKQRFLRNIFFFIYEIDGIILLVTGETLGDRLANTTVLSKKSIENYINPQINTVKDSSVKTQSDIKKRNTKIAVAIVALIVVGIIAFCGFLQIILSMQKNTEEYKAAYNYLITSNEFKEMSADESSAIMTSYSKNIRYSQNGDEAESEARIGFFVNFRTFDVVCHKEDGVWQVCEECTSFD